MKIQAVLFTGLTLLGAVLAFPSTLGDDPNGICKLPIVPTPDSQESICKVAYNGALCKTCDYSWAVYNACECYYIDTDEDDRPDKDTYCGELRKVAVDCENRCDGNCGEENQGPVYGDICKVANKGSLYKECDEIWAYSNACECFGSPYFRDDLGNTNCALLKQSAKACNLDCQSAGCEKHN